MARRGRVARRHGAAARRRGPIGVNWGVGALLAALVVLGVAIWLSSRAGTGSSAPIAMPTAVPTVPLVPPATAAQLALDERQRLPATIGAPIALRDFRGKRVVLALYQEST